MLHNIKHLAIVMDGNARWATINNVSKSNGHKKGAEVAQQIVLIASKLNISYLTLYAFSSENWYRSPTEIDVILNLLNQYINNKIYDLNKNQIKLKIIGDFSKLNNDLKSKIYHAMDLTKDNKKMTACIAFSYGSRSEIVNACQKIIHSNLTYVDETIFSKYMYDTEMPNVDLLIRSGGNYRISNFLLWQLAYAELYFSNRLWPDFNKNEIIKAINHYSSQVRSFGKRKNN